MENRKSGAYKSETHDATCSGELGRNCHCLYTAKKQKHNDGGIMKTGLSEFVKRMRAIGARWKAELLEPLPQRQALGKFHKLGKCRPRQTLVRGAWIPPRNR